MNCCDHKFCLNICFYLSLRICSGRLVLLNNLQSKLHFSASLLFDLLFVPALFFTACGGTFTTMSGVIQSSLYPENYPVDMLCQWVIQLRPQYRVRLEFMDFQLEASTGCQYDFVLVMDGLPSSPTVLGKFCGNSSKSVVDSRTNVMTVLFKSDETKTKKGFQAYWYAQPAIINVTPSHVTPTKVPSSEINGTGECNI